MKRIKKSITIQDIMTACFGDYKRNHNLPRHILSAVAAIIACRTAILGGHVQKCPAGHVERIWYNSCKHRFCPQCAWLQIERWLLKQKSRLLGCDHYHVIFTISDELHTLWLFNVKEMTDLLFRASTETLLELLKDVKYLGARPGIMASLHTWSQTLVLHPHIHCLVTGGGLTEAGRWRSLKRPFLLPKRVVMKKFRGKFLSLISHGLQKGSLHFPPGMNAGQWARKVKKMKKTKWNVKIQERYAHGKGVLTYLSRYVRGGAISNKRLISYHHDQVIFGYRINGEGHGPSKQGTITLSGQEFIRRYILHVPHKGTRVIRYYGLYSPNKKTDLDHCRHQLGQTPVTDPEFLDWQSYCAQQGTEHPERCPVCSELLVCTDNFYPGLPPPDWVLKRAA